MKERLSFLDGGTYENLDHPKELPFGDVLWLHNL